jgi:RNA polymerase sigma-70 factor (ECF subfamily)
MVVVKIVAETKGDTPTVDAEVALVEAAIRGDALAFACLYDRHVERVYRHIHYRVGNRSDAEDLTQQVFLQAWRAINRYEQTGAPFITWLLTIAYHTVVSFTRRLKVVPPLEIEPIADERWADPEAEALAQYDRDVVREAILRLKPDQQQVIIMRFVEHMENEDVAAALGKSVGNVRVIQHRALLELRRLLTHEVKA